LLLTLHHIASDGWSMQLFYNELTALYEAYTGGEASPLEELTMQYADYAQWQREEAGSQRVEKQLSYWKEKLGGQIAVLEMPTDRVRPAMASDRGAREAISISKGTSEGLRRLS